MTIKQELNKDYIGEMIELFEIDLNPIGVAEILRLTPHSETTVLWRGNAYSPFPLTVGGKDSTINQAPGRITLSASTNSSIFTGLMLQHGDLVGGKVRKWRTLTMFLDGQPTADPNQHFPIEEYVIIQRTGLSQDGVSWTLASVLDRPNLIIPRRQCLKEIASRASLYCPGISRTGVRG